MLLCSYLLAAVTRLTPAKSHKYSMSEVLCFRATHTDKNHTHVTRFNTNTLCVQDGARVSVKLSNPGRCQIINTVEGFFVEFWGSCMITLKLENDAAFLKLQQKNQYLSISTWNSWGQFRRCGSLQRTFISVRVVVFFNHSSFIEWTLLLELQLCSCCYSSHKDLTTLLFL